MSAFSRGLKVLGRSTCTCGREDVAIVEIHRNQLKHAVWDDHRTPAGSFCARSRKRAPRLRASSTSALDGKSDIGTGAPRHKMGRPIKACARCGGQRGPDERVTIFGHKIPACAACAGATWTKEEVARVTGRDLARDYVRTADAGQRGRGTRRTPRTDFPSGRSSGRKVAAPAITGRKVPATAAGADVEDQALAPAGDDEPAPAAASFRKGERVDYPGQYENVEIVRAARDGSWYDVNLQPDWGRHRVTRVPASWLRARQAPASTPRTSARRARAGQARKPAPRPTSARCPSCKRPDIPLERAAGGKARKFAIHIRADVPSTICGMSGQNFLAGA